MEKEARRRLFILCSLGRVVFAIMLVFVASNASHGQENRSIEILPEQIHVTLVPDKAKIMLGEPMFLSFIVENRSAVDLQVVSGGDYRNRFGRPERFKVTVSDLQTGPIKSLEAGPTFGGMLTTSRIPAGGSFAFRLLLQHWATIERVGNYQIAAGRVLPLSEYNEKKLGLNVPTIDIPSLAHCSIEIVPHNAQKMGAVIDNIGNAFLARNWEAQIAIRHIDDERVLKYLFRALDIKAYDMKYAALASLAKFRTDSALSGISRALGTTGNDIANTTTRELAEQSAEQIRHSAAVALSKSPHPSAGRVLLTLRHDHNKSIRNTVIKFASTLEPEVAVPILKSMAKDADESIRNEALRYLRDKFGRDQ